jgi:hypothetical protein
MLLGEVGNSEPISYMLEEELSSSFAGGSPTSRASGVRARGGAGIEFLFRRQRRNATSKPTTTRRTMPRAMPVLAPVESPELFDTVVCHGKVKDIYESKELWRGPESIYRKEGVLALSGDIVEAGLDDDIGVEVELDNPVLLVEFERSTALSRSEAGRCR